MHFSGYWVNETYLKSLQETLFGPSKWFQSKPKPRESELLEYMKKNNLLNNNQP